MAKPAKWDSWQPELALVLDVPSIRRRLLNMITNTSTGPLVAVDVLDKGRTILPAGTYEIKISAISGTLAQTVQVTFTVN
jgi:hypothetical protein